jgi:tellurium resistance protein TerD
MGISLRKEIMKKDEEVDLLGVDPTLHKVFVGLGWEAPESQDGHPVDIDASAFILNREGKVRRDTDFIFYNNLETDSGAIQHMGDNTTGEKKEGDTEDAEVIKVSLDTLAFDIEKVAFSVTIHNADDRQQNFGVVKNAYMRVVNAETGSELARFDLTEDAGSDNAMVFGELFREGLGWKFKAMGVGSKGGLFEIARNYGVNVAPP